MVIVVLYKSPTQSCDIFPKQKPIKIYVQCRPVKASDSHDRDYIEYGWEYRGKKDGIWYYYHPEKNGENMIYKMKTYHEGKLSGISVKWRKYNRVHSPLKYYNEIKSIEYYHPSQKSRIIGIDLIGKCYIYQTRKRDCYANYHHYLSHRDTLLPCEFKHLDGTCNISWNSKYTWTYPHPNVNWDNFPIKVPQPKIIRRCFGHLFFITVTFFTKISGRNCSGQLMIIGLFLITILFTLGMSGLLFVFLMMNVFNHYFISILIVFSITFVIRRYMDQLMTWTKRKIRDKYSLITL